MEVYMILYLCILKALLVRASQEGCTGSNCLGEIDDGSCVKAGQCEEREKRETENAYSVRFLVIVAEAVVKTFKGHILQTIVEHFYNTIALDPRDIFNLTMKHYPYTGVSRFLVSFVLQPKTENIDLILQRINIYVDVKTPVEVFGLPMHMEPNSFKASLTVWDGIKTVVRFELMMKYGSLEERGTLEGENQIAEFLHEQFQISLRDIYDITFMETEHGNTAVEFSLPPIMTKQKQTLLTNMEFFFGGSCEDTCKLQGNTDTADECKSCGYVSVFGTNVYTDHQSFQSRTETWTGNERRFAMMEIESDVCPDHQEICTSGQSGPKCVGIGRCEPNFYKTIILSIEVYGNIKLLDLFGMDVAIAAIEDSSADFYGFCRSAIQAKFFDHGRSKTGMSLWVKPSPGRKEAVEKLFDTLEKNDKVQFENFVVNILENSFTSTYLEPRWVLAKRILQFEEEFSHVGEKPIPKYVDNHCFGCADKEVWCILSNKSLCLSKFDCLEKQALPTKFAIDTEIVRVSILMLSDKDFVTVTEDFKNVMRQQIADQLFCSKELLTKVNMVESEDGKFELGFDITLRDDNTELKKLVILLQRIVDLEQLEIITTEAYFIAVSESLMFQQFISGYPKPRKDEGVSSYFWNAVVGGSFFALLILVFTLLVKAGRKLHNRPVYQTPDVNAENHKTVEKASKRRPEIQSFLKRK